VYIGPYTCKDRCSCMCIAWRIAMHICIAKGCVQESLLSCRSTVLKVVCTCTKSLFICRRSVSHIASSWLLYSYTNTVPKISARYIAIKAATIVLVFLCNDSNAEAESREL